MLVFHHFRFVDFSQTIVYWFDKVTAKWGKGKQFEIGEKLAMASSDFPDGGAYRLKDEDGYETWTNSTCIAIGITSPIQLRLF